MCPSILAVGRASEIKAIKEELGSSYEKIVELCPSVLAHVKNHDIKRLKKRLGDRFLSIVERTPSVLYSEEEPIKQSLESCEKTNSGRPVPGSISFVPSVAGLLIAGEVIRDLIQYNNNVR